MCFALVAASCGEPAAESGNWDSVGSARGFIELRRADQHLAPPRPLSDSDWRHLLALLTESCSVTVGGFLGQAADRPAWVTRELLIAFRRAASVNLGLNYEPPGSVPEFYHLRRGCIEFFLSPHGRTSEALQMLVVLEERHLDGVENLHMPQGRIWRAIARVSMSDPTPLLGLLESTGGNRLMRSRLCQAITETAGEWGPHRERLLDALLARVRLDDDGVAAEAVRAIGQNGWLTVSVAGIVRARFDAMSEGTPKEDVRRWLDRLGR